MSMRNSGEEEFRSCRRFAVQVLSTRCVRGAACQSGQSSSPATETVLMASTLTAAKCVRAASHITKLFLRHFLLGLRIRGFELQFRVKK